MSVSYETYNVHEGKWFRIVGGRRYEIAGEGGRVLREVVTSRPHTPDPPAAPAMPPFTAPVTPVVISKPPDAPIAIQPIGQPPSNPVVIEPGLVAPAPKPAPLPVVPVPKPAPPPSSPPPVIPDPFAGITPDPGAALLSPGLILGALEGGLATPLVPPTTNPVVVPPLAPTPLVTPPLPKVVIPSTETPTATPGLTNPPPGAGWTNPLPGAGDPGDDPMMPSLGPGEGTTVPWPVIDPPESRYWGIVGASNPFEAFIGGGANPWSWSDAPVLGDPGPYRGPEVTDPFPGEPFKNFFDGTGDMLQMMGQMMPMLLMMAMLNMLGNFGRR